VGRKSRRANQWLLFLGLDAGCAYFPICELTCDLQACKWREYWLEGTFVVRIQSCCLKMFLTMIPLQCTSQPVSLDLQLLLSYIREWNSNARFCHTAQAVLSGVMRVHPPDTLAEVTPVFLIRSSLRAPGIVYGSTCCYLLLVIHGYLEDSLRIKCAAIWFFADQVVSCFQQDLFLPSCESLKEHYRLTDVDFLCVQVPQIKEIVEGLLPYSQRHFNRMDRLVRSP
jgi:hypothetical protein